MKRPFIGLALAVMALPLMGADRSDIDYSRVVAASVDLAHSQPFYCYLGRPLNLEIDRPVDILVNHGYLVGFSERHLQPAWAAYEVSEARRDVDYGRPDFFYDDTRLPPSSRIGNWTFGRVDGVSYDRGHMVPNFAINKQFGRIGQLETFLMSNIAPQTAGLNQRLWQRLEKRIIEDYAQDKEHVWVLVGPIFGDDPKVISRQNGLEVPIANSFFAILVDTIRWPHDAVDNVRILALEFPQDATGDLDNRFLSTIDAIEAKTGLNFLPQLRPSDEHVEASPAAEIWPP